MGNCTPSRLFKTTNTRKTHLKFLRFFQTISDKKDFQTHFLKFP